jgi:hypothetical protein
MLKELKIRCKKHLRFIASLPCIVCWIEGLTQAAHIRSGNLAGTGLKPGDNCTVPLCVGCHAKQHRIGERKFWAPFGGTTRATKISNLLYRDTGDRTKAVEHMRELHNVPFAI